ncbi:MAG: putative DNA binding domain-containing protein [Bacteroidales bacterium]|nr:putative DNA binding domain-containing protein [Bacteroidales bacterium]
MNNTKETILRAEQRIESNHTQPYRDTMNERPTLWLDLQPEYIDVNLDKFIQYLYDKRDDDHTDDIFYLSSIDLLCNRVEQLCDEMAHRPIGAVLEGESSEDEATTKIRILALYMLVKAYPNLTAQHLALACLDLLMVRISHETLHEALLNEAVRMMTTTGRVVVKFGWNDLRTFEPFLFAGLLLKSEVPAASAVGPLWYSGNGSAMLAERCLTVVPMSEVDFRSSKTQKSLTLCEGHIELRSLPRLKLNQTKTGDYDTLQLFFREYLQAMFPIDAAWHKKQRYQEGDSLLVRVVRTSFERIDVVSTDPQYERISGTCTFDNKFFYTIRDFSTHLPVGHDIPVVLKSVNDSHAIFDLTQTFKDFMIDEYEETSIGTLTLARAVEEKNGYMWWWSQAGFSLSTPDHGFKKGEYAWMTISNKSREQGYINAHYEYPAEEDEEFEDFASRRNCIVSFCYEPDDTTIDDDLQAAIDSRFIQILARIIYVLQKNISLPIERYKLLGLTEVLCKMSGDLTAMHYADFTAQTLRNMVFFACGQYKRIYVPEPDESIEDMAGVKRRSNIVYILKQYNDNPDEDFLNMMIEGSDQLLSNLAQLVQSGNRLRNVLSGAMQRQIELEITRQLTVDEEAQTDFTDGDDNYFGVEDDRKEFKTSFVFPPDNHMQPNEAQQKHNVFKGVCAMLNSREGGVVYLGVNDHGLVSGLQADFDHLHLHTMDAYMRHISDEAKKSFGLDLMQYIHLEPIHEERVVAIKVDPCDFKVVELDGVAYVRANAESRKMDDATRMYTLNRKLHFDASRARLENALSVAIEHHRQAVLLGYRSSSSNSQEDRHVEPFAFTKGNKYIWCFDLDAAKVKLFAISRIRDVKIESQPWAHQSEHKEGHTDLFHMTGDKAQRIQLALDTQAYNLLIEEYDGAESQLTKTTDGHWLLDTEVYGMQGIGRFYLGLARNIEIINAPGLKEYAKDYISAIL